MHKNLHKDLYSKRNEKKYYPPVINISISPSDNIDYETEENISFVIEFVVNITRIQTKNC